MADSHSPAGPRPAADSRQQGASQSQSQSPSQSQSHSQPQSQSPSRSSSQQPSVFDGSTLRNPSLDRGDDRVNEQSPLLAANRDSDDPAPSDNPAQDGPDDSQKTKSPWYLILLTISLGGLQIAWSVELSNGSPYLLSLGLSKSWMALVWIAGPLTGTLVQPYVGMLSDNCRLPWGKRKPFMVGGSLATVMALMFLAWAKELVAGILGLFGADPESQGVKMTTMVVAVIGIYVLDFAINTVQAAIRAFIVDCAPAHQQEAANATASRITGIGNIVGYVGGYIDLPKHLWFLGNTQFQVLCALASVALLATITLSTAVIHERDPRLDGPPQQNKPGVITFFRSIFKSIKSLPPQIKRVCEVQFLAWIGFFPLLFYTSSYIGEIYAEPYLRENPHMTPAELDKLYESGVRIGSFALLVNSVVSLLTNVILPFFIAPTYDSCPVISEVPGETNAAPQSRSSLLDKLVIPGLTLKRAWFLSLIIFSGAMFCTVLVRTIQAATALVGLVGVTWAMTLWAPWAIISAEISRRDAKIRAQKSRAMSPGRHSEATTSPTLNELSQHNGGSSVSSKDDEVDQAGLIIGIHNMAIAAPQIIATIGSSLIFENLQKPRGTPGDRSYSIVLALGGAFVFIASFFVAKIKDDTSMPADAMSDEEQGRTARGGSEPQRPKSSHNQRPRTSQARATLTRNKSFGGAEMN